MGKPRIAGFWVVLRVLWVSRPIIRQSPKKLRARRNVLYKYIHIVYIKYIWIAGFTGESAQETGFNSCRAGFLMTITPLTCHPCAVTGRVQPGEASRHCSRIPLKFSSGSASRLYNNVTQSLSEVKGITCLWEIKSPPSKNNQVFELKKTFAKRENLKWDKTQESSTRGK